MVVREICEGLGLVKDVWKSWSNIKGRALYQSMIDSQTYLGLVDHSHHFCPKAPSHNTVEMEFQCGEMTNTGSNIKLSHNTFEMEFS